MTDVTQKPIPEVDYAPIEERILAHMEYHGATTGRFAPSDKPKWPCRGDERKNVERPVCHGKDVPCLPGKGGKCVAWADDD
jgi:hypothetical protein